MSEKPDFRDWQNGTAAVVLKYELSIADLTRQRDEARARVKGLKDALREMVYDATHLSPRADDGSHTAKISAATLEHARTALQEQSK